ncbi:unnamed protein product [Ostreobium quekettii]|uniref:Metallo-beta-lactamase domain-containing protein n=1 Tax=Ostreobium quekettii TaxID=121088 RepID=A0A8S1J068_9CHLO|nr:unnamed protein product [Ostreobium quekettii]|eukprot:evm.model.scf_22.12 EVM.evm.TU.scf_22.12   scf_22:200503-201832(+)
MRVTFLGTGCPVPSPHRFGPSQVVRHGDTAILIDCGSGVTQRLAAAGLSGADLDAVLLTHLHSDHVMDVFQLILSSWHQGRQRPQKIFGPPGTKVYVDGLMALWRAEMDQRIAHERRPSTSALETEVTEFGPGWVGRFGEMEVSAVQVDHRPVVHAYGFALTACGRRLVVSGDTRPCEGLVEAARGADVLVHEVVARGGMPVVEGVRTAETVANVESYHTRSDQVGAVAAEAGVGCLVLTHVTPPGTDRAALLEEVGKHYGGPVVVAEDLATIDVERMRVTFASGGVVALGRH